MAEAKAKKLTEAQVRESLRPGEVVVQITCKSVTVSGKSCKKGDYAPCNKRDAEYLASVSRGVIVEAKKANAASDAEE